MHRLEPESVVSELRCQPVEQLWVAGAAAVEAKVVRCLDDAGAEMMMPQSIDQHAGEQRIVPVCQPSRQLPAPFVVGCVLLDAKVALQHPQRRDRAGPDDFAFVHRIAAFQQSHRAGVAAGGHGVNLHRRAVAQRPLAAGQVGQLILERPAPGLFFRAQRGGQFRFADERRFHPGRGGDRIRPKRAVIKLGAVNFAVQEVVPAAAVAHAEDHLRAAAGKILPPGFVRFAVWQAVAIAGDRAVLVVDNGDVHRLLVCLVFLR